MPDKKKIYTSFSFPHFNLLFWNTSRQVWPLLTLLSFHVLIWVKNTWKSTKPAPTTWPTWPSSAARKINFPRGITSVWFIGGLAGVIVGAAPGLSGFEAPPPIPAVSEINSDAGLKSQNREILFRGTDWLKGRERWVRGGNRAAEIRAWVKGESSVSHDSENGINGNPANATRKPVLGVVH